MISRCISFAICFLFTVTAFAGTSTSGYQLSDRPAMKSINPKDKVTFPPTDITLINASSDIVNVAIPGDTFTDVIFPTTSKHLVNYHGAFNTPIAFKDPFYAQFFTGILCPYAVVTIFGRPGYYKVTVDSEYCT
jgi:hypothetical protein